MFIQVQRIWLVANTNMAKTQATKKPAKSAKAVQPDTKSGMSKIVEEDEHKLLADEDINSGFGNYLRSQEGLYL